MRLVEEEHHLRLRQVAHLRHHVEELRHQPEHEGGVDRRVVDQGRGVEDVDHPSAFPVCPEEITDLQRGLSEELFPAASLQGHKGAHDDADALGADISVLFPVYRRIVADIVQHRLQILEIQKKHTLIVRDPEDDVQKVGLGLVQLQESREQERAELGDCGPESQPPLSHDVPERRRICLIAESRFREAEPFYPLLHVLAVDPGPAHAGQVALDIGQEYGYACVGERFRQDLQGDRLSCSGRARDESVTVGHPGQDAAALFAAGGDPDLIVSIHNAFLLMILARRYSRPRSFITSTDSIA